MSYKNAKAIYRSISEQGPVDKKKMRLFFDDLIEIKNTTGLKIEEILSMDLYSFSAGLKKYNSETNKKEDIKMSQKIDFTNDIEVADIMTTVKNYIEDNFSQLCVTQIFHNKSDSTLELLSNISGEVDANYTSLDGEQPIAFKDVGVNLGTIHIPLKDESITFVINEKPKKLDNDIQTNIELLQLHNQMINGVDYIQQQVEINKNKYNEELTGLYNGKYLEDTLNKEDHGYSFIFIDVARFKEINDEYGHVVGDMVLIEIADMLTKTVRGVDKVTRLGGDEFAVLFKNPEDKENIQKGLNNLISRIEKYPLEVVNPNNGECIYPKLSIGSAKNDGDIHKNKMALLEEANKMMSENKDPAGAAYRLLSMFASFDQDTKVLALDRILIDTEARKYFYNAILTEPVTQSFFKGLKDIFIELKKNPLIRNRLGEKSIESLEEFRNDFIKNDGYRSAA